jgi:hypothetical protein
MTTPKLSQRGITDAVGTISYDLARRAAFPPTDDSIARAVNVWANVNKPVSRADRHKIVALVQVLLQGAR